MTEIEELELRIKKLHDDYIAKLMDTLQTDPAANDQTRNHSDLPGYLQRLVYKDGSVLKGIINALERHLER